MKVTVYGIRNCDTVKKAFAWLEANRVEHVFHDYRKLGVPAAKLEACVAHLNAMSPRPDIVLLTGDLVDFGRPEEYHALRRILAPLAGWGNSISAA